MTEAEIELCERAAKRLGYTQTQTAVENIESIDSAIQRQRSAILQAIMWLDVGADGRAREVLLEALNK